MLAFEAKARLLKLDRWSLIAARNAFFQRQALRVLRVLQPRIGEAPGSTSQYTQHGSANDLQPVLFSYSYAARDIFRYAKARGWLTVLGQIDAGPAMERIVREQATRWPGWQPTQAFPPDSYWQEWREECSLADRIVVNSEWVRDALGAEGVEIEKIIVVPLAYETTADRTPFALQVPERFDAGRPLRVLVLGQMTLLKGVADVLGAAQLLAGAPIEFTMVGPLAVIVPPRSHSQRTVRWVGAVPRGRTAEYYDAADVLLFPSHGDGFGIVQLEAIARRLPVIASSECGRVVEDRVNGLRLTEVTPESIAQALRYVLANPDQLRAWSKNARLNPEFSLAAIGQRFLNL